MARIGAAHRRRKKALRLLAWRHYPEPRAKGHEFVEVYNCDKDCGLGTPQEDRGRRREWHCGILDMHPAEWRGDPEPMAPMGLPPAWRPEYIASPREPVDEGCPGAWYRCRFVDRLIQYFRPVTAEGVYSSSPMLDRTHDPLVLAAIRYYEGQHGQAHARNMRVLHGD